MNANEQKHVERVMYANRAVIFCSLSYGIIRSADCILDGEQEKLAIIIPLMLIQTVFLYIIMRNTKEPEKLAFFAPMITLACFLASTLILKGSAYFFIFYICLCGLSSIYFNFSGMLSFLIMANTAFIVIILIFRFPVMGGNVTFNQVIIHWVISTFATMFLTFISRYSTNKHIESVRAKDSFDTMLNSTPNIIALIDEHNCITYISKSLAEIADAHEDAILKGLPIVDLFNDFDMKLIMNEIMTAEGLYEKMVSFPVDGKPQWFKVTSDRMSGVTRGRFIDVANVTPIMNAKLEAERATEAKSSFLATMSHEIRTPMNAVSGLSELILREDISPKVHEYAVAIKQSSANLMTIINDILDFSKVESGKLEIVPADYLFASLINDVISTIRIRIIDKPVKFIVNIDPGIPNNLIGDEIRIRQILINLLGNACKYTDDGFISLNVTGDFKSANTVLLTIEVSDSGRGVKEADLDRLFDDFIRIDMVENKSIHGTGLGLTIAKNLCYAMGGGISVESVYGKGSTFTVTLPQKFGTYERFAQVKNTNPAENSVLIYEPRTTYASSIAKEIRSLGVKCELASNRQEFYGKLKDFKFTFVASFLIEDAKGIIERLKPDVRPVLIADNFEAANTKNIRVLSMPAYSISIANILNDTTDGINHADGSEGAALFRAPTARILIVDDVGTNLKVAEGLMASYEMCIDSCKKGADAIRLVKENRYDIIFMDHMMPEMDGIEATIRIRELDGDTEYYKSVPVIALTANVMSGVKEMFLLNGFNDFLAKPIEISKLGEMLGKWVPAEKKERVSEKKEEASSPAFIIDGVDTKSGIARLGGKVDSYKIILRAFYKDGTEKSEQINTCLLNADIDLYTVYVHALKGAAASIGAIDLSELARSLEDAGRRKDTAFIEENTGELLKELGILLKNISAVISQDKDNKPHGQGGEADLAFLKEEFLKLKQAVKTLDTAAADEIIMGLKKNDWDVGISDVIENISQCILLCEYEEAVGLIDGTAMT